MGWDVLAKEQKVAQASTPDEKVPPIANEKTPTDSSSQFPDLAAEFVAQTEPKVVKASHVFCGVVGHEGAGKTGIVMDGHMHRYEDAMLWAIDFDNGALACRGAHYGETDLVRTFSPWVMQMTDRTAYNYPATHQRVMDICKFAIEYAQNQQAEDFDGPLLKTFLVTAVDQFDSVCINNMKIFDLEMDAKDAIEASAARLNQDIGWNWQIRSTRFHQLTALCRQLNLLGVDVYWETHLKPDEKSTLHTFDGWKFAWEKHSLNNVNQILWCKAQTVRDSDGSPTGEVRYFVDFFKEKTNSNLKGQERVFFVTKKVEDAQWFGLSELRDGIL